MNIDFKAFSDEPVEIYFHIEREQAELILHDLLTVLHKIDATVQEIPKTKFEIAYINIYENNIQICYYGVTANTEFDVEVYETAGQWYCKKLGMTTYNPPMGI